MALCGVDTNTVAKVLAQTALSVPRNERAEKRGRYQLASKLLNSFSVLLQSRA